jgi:hypothetical protein
VKLATIRSGEGREGVAVVLDGERRVLVLDSAHERVPGGESAALASMMALIEGGQPPGRCRSCRSGASRLPRPSARTLEVVDVQRVARREKRPSVGHARRANASRPSSTVPATHPSLVHPSPPPLRAAARPSPRRGRRPHDLSWPGCSPTRTCDSSGRRKRRRYCGRCSLLASTTRTRFGLGPCGGRAAATAFAVGHHLA